MQVSDPPEQDPAGEDGEKDPLTRFRSWRGFLFVSIAVNALFLYGTFNAVADPSVAAWYKALTWLPFNAIATVLYLVFMVKLSRADADRAEATGGIGRRAGHATAYAVLCLAMIAANWIALVVA